MARIRTIKPEFPQSESVGRLSREARLLFIQLWTIVDDSSRARASSRLLASLLYPYDEDAPTLMVKWLRELSDEGFIHLYKHEGTHYLDIPKWRKHQKIDRPSPSRLPAFEDSEKQGGVDHRGGSFDEPSTSPREDTSSPRRALAAGPRTVDLGPRTVDRTPLAQKPSASEPTQNQPAVLEYPCEGKVTTWPLTQAQVDTWGGLYPSTDVLGECRKALAWVEANATRRKTANGMPKFLVGWLNRASTKPADNTRGGNDGAHPNPNPHPQPKPCTCGDSYRQSYNRRCTECDGRPSPAQTDAVRATQRNKSTTNVSLVD